MRAAPSSTTERRELGHACYGIQTATTSLDDAKNFDRGVLQRSETREEDFDRSPDTHMGTSC